MKYKLPTKEEHKEAYKKFKKMIAERSKELKSKMSEEEWKQFLKNEREYCFKVLMEHIENEHPRILPYFKYINSKYYE